MSIRMGIIDDYNIYSTTVFTQYLFSELSNTFGVDVICYVPRYRSSFGTGSIPKTNVKAIWSSFDYPLRIFHRLRRDNRNIVFVPLEQKTFGETVFSLAIFPFFMVLCKLAGCKIIVNLQGVFPLNDFASTVRKLIPNLHLPWFIVKLGVFAIYYWIFRLSDQIQVFSKTFGKWVEGYGNFRKKIKNIQLGVDLSNPILNPSSASTRFTDLLSKSYLLTFGYVVPRKGLDNLIEAWQIVHTCHPRETLVIAGSIKKDPAYVNSLLRKIKVKNLASSIIMTGATSSEEMHQLYEHCVATIFPYVYSDAPSGPLCTALQHRKPIIASNIGYFSDLLAAGGGILCEPGNALSLSQAICHFLCSTELKNKLVEESKSLAERLDWTAVGREYKRLISQVLDSD